MSVLERFLKYVSYGTNSDEDSETCPSTPGQLALGRELARELRELGVEGAHLDEYGYVYGFIPATEGHENDPTVGFIAHMDTSPAVRGDGVRPHIVHYNGGDIALNEDAVLSPREYPALNDHIGDMLVVTDGTTLLGADDKAGIAEIFTACEYLAEHPEISHGAISVCVTPDEEIGRGADRFDLEKFGADWAYTIDGGELGEIEYECFNAASADITVHGLNIHPGDAKNKMKNAALLATEFASLLPPAETPAHTEGYEGFFHLCSVSGDETEAKLKYIVRDHDREKFENRKQLLRNTAAYLNGVYGEGTFEVALRDSYYNMKEKILPHMFIVENAREAMRRCGVSPRDVAIRGGTDGARLSYEGLPCPNLSTGGANYHSIHEYVSVSAMETMVRVIVELMQ
ncbi:MAG: peptidase T [Clostridia bacterium]|nr:peptidase T [Clostridia bacterium]